MDNEERSDLIQEYRKLWGTKEKSDAQKERMRSIEKILNLSGEKILEACIDDLINIQTC